jgi:hypothetical protein
MKLVAWIREEECNKAIACKLHVNKGLSGLVIERKPFFLKNLSAGEMFEKARESFALGQIKSAWNGMQQYYRSNFPSYPGIQTIYCESINDPEVISFTNKFSPDIVLLSGVEVHEPKSIETNLKTVYLQIHHGLAPYVNEGNNSTNRCLSNKTFHLLGNAILCLSSNQQPPGIISNETTFFEGKEKLKDIYIKIMEHGHDLCLRSLRMISEGKWASNNQEEVIGADLTKNKEWGFAEKKNLIKGLAAFSRHVNSSETKRLREQLKLYSLRR